MRLTVPDPALVLLVGPSGAGKSTFAERHFKPSEIISSDLLREMISDDPSNQDASAEAFRVLTIVANGRLKRRLTTVVDATSLGATNRRRYHELASRYGVPVVAIAFDFALATYAAHNRLRPDRNVDDEVVEDQSSRMRDAIAALPAEDYTSLYVFRDPTAAHEATVERVTHET